MIFHLSNGFCATGLPGNACLTCHPYQADDFSSAHGFAQASCISCHAGDQETDELPRAHQGLIAKPGDLREDRAICANCHPRQAKNVTSSLMNTARGLVVKTRRALGEEAATSNRDDIETLADSPADSMLRKLCASCHLSHRSELPVADATQARGGGCSACHINRREQDRHPRLSAQVEDARCFGCHSRSGRVSLNYVGLAEADPDPALPETKLLQLTDGRTLVTKANDIHHQAGMSCIDCHTSTGVMGGGDNSGFKHQAVDIQCVDCHAPAIRWAGEENWPAGFPQMQRYLHSEKLSGRRVPLSLRYGTPLWHVEILDDGGRLLHPKLGGTALPIPDYASAQHPYARQHARLTCSACHSQWAPQCYGCHSQYDPEASQWDHLAQRKTLGRWRETRWDVRAELPPLGVDEHDRIRPVTPGMILSVTHPAWDQALFKRLFAPSEPHTTGKARSCESCHRDSTALGLGQGELSKQEGHWSFQPTKKRLQDRLPADAWTSLDGMLKGGSTDGKLRPFNVMEIRRILNADLSPGNP
jgi:hypothetical protein